MRIEGPTNKKFGAHWGSSWYPYGPAHPWAGRSDVGRKIAMGGGWQL